MQKPALLQLVPGPVLLLCCGALLLAVPLGVRQSFGLFLPEFMAFNPRGTAHFSLAIALQNLAWGLCSPVFGLWADRRGAGRVAAAGAACYVLGILLMSASLTSPGGLLAGQLLIGIGMSGCGFSVVFGAVARAVPEPRRSLALGVVSAGGSLGQFCGPLAVGWLLATFQWSTTLLLLAVPAAFLVVTAAGLTERRTSTTQAPLPAWAARDFIQRDYVLLTAGFFVCGLQVVFIMTHLPAYLADRGLPATYASWSLAFIGLFNIVGTLACGWLGGRLRKKNILGTIYLARSAAILAFVMLPTHGYTVLVFGAVMGLLWLGTVPLTSGLVAYLCGTGRMATFYGVTFLSHQLGSFVGAWLGGVLRSLTGDYGLMWLVVGLAGLVAAALHYPIREAAPAHVPARP